MQRIVYALSTGLLAILALAGCVDDSLIKTKHVVEGQPITVTLNLASAMPSDVVVSRADDNSFSALSNLIIFVYSHTSGSFEQIVSSTSGTLTYSIDTSDNLYEVQFKTTSGSKDLLAVANTSSVAEDGGFWENIARLGTLAQHSTFEELKVAIINLREELRQTTEIQPIQIVSSSQMFVSGWNSEVIFDIDGTVSSYGSYGEQSSEIAIKMERAMARVSFNIEAAPEGAAGTFIPTSYRVYNVPVSSYLTNMNTTLQETPSDKFTFVDYLSTNVESVSGGKYSFSFYMPENIYEEIRKNDDVALDYVDREKWNSSEDNAGALPGEKKWTYAPPTSTFVVISGNYNGSVNEGNTTTYSGTVEYTVHLGDFSENGSCGNFSVERNCSYIYNMKVLGVNNIIVEAQKNEENQPGAEGQIFDNSHTVYNYQLDAHYEQVYLEYNLTAMAQGLDRGLTGEELDNAIADNLILVIQSEAMDYTHTGDDYTVRNKRGTLKPYKLYADAVRAGNTPSAIKSEILDGAGTGNNPTKGFDYKWIEFWPQTEENVLAAYPGVSRWSREDLTGLVNNAEIVYGSEEPTAKSEHLLDVYDMVVAMGKVVKKIYSGMEVSTTGHAEDGITITNIGTDDESPVYVARFTAFVNEYYYYKHPLTHAAITTWNVMTNKIPREMIIAMSSEVSTDGNSSLSKLHSYISQLSMQTFYNSRNIQLNGFGIETYNETPLVDQFRPNDISSSSVDLYLDDSDGRSNQLRLLGADKEIDDVLVYDKGDDWGTYVSIKFNGWFSSPSTVPQEHKLNNAYPDATKGAYAACMSRNRDLNGDGKIQDNEIRWYLASMNEYIRIGISARAISSTARLYMGDKQDMRVGSYPNSYLSDGAIYYTSSYGKDDETSKKRVYWAVEKGSYGAENAYYKGGIPLRCIRMLPAIVEGKQDVSTIGGIVAASTVEKIEQSDGIILKFKDRLVESLYRQRSDGALEPHNEDNPANSYFEGIFVAEQSIDNSNIIGIINGGLGKMVNPCEGYRQKINGTIYTGWRVPNLVEFSAMNAVGLLGNGAVCCTQFSNLGVRAGYVYNQNRILCPTPLTDNQGNSIRCVRDVPEGFFDSNP